MSFWPELRCLGHSTQEAAFTVCQVPGGPSVLARASVLVRGFLFSNRWKFLAEQKLWTVLWLSQAWARISTAEGAAHPWWPRRVIRLVCASPRPGASNYTSGACRSPGGRLTCSRTVKPARARFSLPAHPVGEAPSLCVTSIQIIITTFQRQQESTYPGCSFCSKHCHNFIFPSMFQALPLSLFHLNFPPAPNLNSAAEHGLAPQRS